MDSFTSERFWDSLIRLAESHPYVDQQDNSFQPQCHAQLHCDQGFDEGIDKE